MRATSGVTRTGGSMRRRRSRAATSVGMAPSPEAAEPWPPRPARDELDPARALLGERHAPEIRRAPLARQDRAALGEQELGLAQQLGVLARQPAGAAAAAGLLVGHGEQDHVALEGSARGAPARRGPAGGRRRCPSRRGRRDRRRCPPADRALEGAERPTPRGARARRRDARAARSGRPPPRPGTRAQAAARPAAAPSDGVGTTRASIPSARSSPPDTRRAGARCPAGSPCRSGWRARGSGRRPARGSPRGRCGIRLRTASRRRRRPASRQEKRPPGGPRRSIVRAAEPPARAHSSAAPIARGLPEKACEFVISRTVREPRFARFFMRGLGA